VSETPDETTQGEETQEQDGPEPATEPTPEEEEAEAEEAEQVEGVPSEPGEASPSEQPPEQPAQPEGLSEKQIEAGFRKLDREAERHRNRVKEIMGEEYGVLLACPMCDQINPGYVMPTPEVPQRFPAVREFMGDSQPRELKHDQNLSRCQVCDGWGIVESGSRVEGQRELACTECGGRGWLGQRAGLALTTADQFAPTPANGAPSPVPASAGDPPDVAALKARGYMVIDPQQPAST
jgi:hypothetical protein